VDESVVVGSFPVGDRTGGTAIDGEDAAIDAGFGVERIGGDAPCETEVEPRSPLRGHHGRTADSGAFAGHPHWVSRMACCHRPVRSSLRRMGVVRWKGRLPTMTG